MMYQMKKIRLSKGLFSLVDDEDYEFLLKNNWHVDDKGYAVRNQYIPETKKHKSIKMHRVIMKCPKGLEVDHIDWDRLDNRKCNLRIVTRAQNSQNVKMRIDNTSGYIGVFDRKNGRYRAYYNFNGKRVNLGEYDSAEKAHKARAKALKKLNGSLHQI